MFFWNILSFRQKQISTKSAQDPQHNIMSSEKKFNEFFTHDTRFSTIPGIIMYCWRILPMFFTYFWHILPISLHIFPHISYVFTYILHISIVLSYFFDTHYLFFCIYLAHISCIFLANINDTYKYKYGKIEYTSLSDKIRILLGFIQNEYDHPKNIPKSQWLRRVVVQFCNISIVKYWFHYYIFGKYHLYWHQGGEKGSHQTSIGDIARGNDDDGGGWGWC